MGKITNTLNVSTSLKILTYWKEQLDWIRSNIKVICLSLLIIFLSGIKKKLYSCMWIRVGPWKRLSFCIFPKEKYVILNYLNLNIFRTKKERVLLCFFWVDYTFVHFSLSSHIRYEDCHGFCGAHGLMGETNWEPIAECLIIPQKYPLGAIGA